VQEECRIDVGYFRRYSDLIIIFMGHDAGFVWDGYGICVGSVWDGMWDSPSFLGQSQNILNLTKVFNDLSAGYLWGEKWEDMDGVGLR
jgi:hypothetical protein